MKLNRPITNVNNVSKTCSLVVGFIDYVFAF